MGNKKFDKCIYFLWFIKNRFNYISRDKMEKSMLQQELLDRKANTLISSTKNIIKW